MREIIEKIFRTHNMRYDYNIVSSHKVEVEIVWGDWKHDHIALDQIMRKNGFVRVGEQITEESGDDAYSSIHTYIRLANITTK